MRSAWTRDWCSSEEREFIFFSSGRNMNYPHRSWNFYCTGIIRISLPLRHYYLLRSWARVGQCDHEARFLHRDFLRDLASWLRSVFSIYLQQKEITKHTKEITIYLQNSLSDHIPYSRLVGAVKLIGKISLVGPIIASFANRPLESIVRNSIIHVRCTYNHSSPSAGKSIMSEDEQNPWILWKRSLFILLNCPWRGEENRDAGKCFTWEIIIIHLCHSTFARNVVKYPSFRYFHVFMRQVSFILKRWKKKLRERE